MSDAPRHASWIVFVLGSIVGLAEARAQLAPFFQAAPGFDINALSADGETAVGDVGVFAGIWRHGGTVSLLPTSGFPSSATSASAISISWDGSVISGRVRTDVQYPCWWNASRSCSLFMENGVPIRGLEARAVSPNANAILFNYNDWGANGTLHLMSRSVDGTVERLPVSPIGTHTTATSCSYDGRIFVGNVAATGSIAFRWAPGEGFLFLPSIPGNPVSTIHNDIPWACDASGDVVVGQMGGSPNPTRAFRWTPRDGTIGLGVLPGQTTSVARGVSADGRFVVGTSGSMAFVWDHHNGMRSLREVVLLQTGTDPGPLSAAFAISADGRTIGGHGYILRLRAPCAGDVDDGSGTGGRDDAVTTDDLTFFIQHLLAGDMLVDLDDGSGTGHPDGAVTIEDLLYFLGGYLGGC